MPGSRAFSASQRPWTPPCCRRSTEKPMPRKRPPTLAARQADRPPPRHVPIIQITTCQPGSRTPPLRRIEPRSRARPCPVVRHGPRRPRWPLRPPRFWETFNPAIRPHPAGSHTLYHGPVAIRAAACPPKPGPLPTRSGSLARRALAERFPSAPGPPIGPDRRYPFPSQAAPRFPQDRCPMPQRRPCFEPKAPYARRARRPQGRARHH